MIENINVLINVIEDIQFLHCNRIVNRLVDKLAKKRLIFVILRKSVLINFLEFPFNYIYIYIRREWLLMWESEKDVSCFYMITYNHSNHWISSSSFVKQDSKISYPTRVDELSVLVKLCIEYIDHSIDFFGFCCAYFD